MVYILLSVDGAKGDEPALLAREYTSVCACFNLRAASRRMTSLYNQRLKESGVLITQLPILGTLRQAGPMPLTRLAELLEMDRTTLARNWLPLVREGLTSEQASPDRRVRVLAITAKGTKALRTALALWKEAQASVVKELGEGDYRTLLAQLGRLQRLSRGE